MNHESKPQSMLDEFIEWVDTYRSFKHYDHEDLVKEFNPKAEVWFEQRQFDSDRYYGRLTFINFPDDSELVINYKGEVEFSYEPKPTPRSSSPCSLSCEQ